MTHRITSTSLRRIAALLLAGTACAGAFAHTFDADAAARALVAGLDKPGGIVHAVATGHHVDIDQTVALPADLPPDQLQSRLEQARKLNLDKSCHSSALQLMMDNGVTITWRYGTPDGKPLMAIELNKDTCAPIIAATPASGAKP